MCYIERPRYIPRYPTEEGYTPWYQEIPRRTREHIGVIEQLTERVRKLQAQNAKLRDKLNEM